MLFLFCVAYEIQKPELIAKLLNSDRVFVQNSVSKCAQELWFIAI